MINVQSVSEMIKLNVGFIWYPVMTLGYGKRLGVWFQGCSKKCENCISPEFQVPEAGTMYTIKEIFDSLPIGLYIDGLTISGGEPFDQAEGLLELVMAYKENFNDDILIFTGYTLEELHKKESLIIEKILQNIAVLVDGKYVGRLNNGKGLRGSTNQNINVWKYHERYNEAEESDRKMQCVLMNGRLWMLGIPPE